jgi:hypothetical protein
MDFADPIVNKMVSSAQNSIDLYVRSSVLDTIDLEELYSKTKPPHQDHYLLHTFVWFLQGLSEIVTSAQVYDLTFLQDFEDIFWVIPRAGDLEDLGRMVMSFDTLFRTGETLERCLVVALVNASKNMRTGSWIVRCRDTQNNPFDEAEGAIAELGSADVALMVGLVAAVASGANAAAIVTYLTNASDETYGAARTGVLAAFADAETNWKLIRPSWGGDLWKAFLVQLCVAISRYDTLVVGAATGTEVVEGVLYFYPAGDSIMFHTTARLSASALFSGGRGGGGASGECSGYLAMDLNVTSAVTLSVTPGELLEIQVGYGGAGGAGGQGPNTSAVAAEYQHGQAGSPGGRSSIKRQGIGLANSPGGRGGLGAAPALGRVGGAGAPSCFYGHPGSGGAAANSWTDYPAAQTGGAGGEYSEASHPFNSLPEANFPTLTRSDGLPGTASGTAPLARQGQAGGAPGPAVSGWKNSWGGSGSGGKGGFHGSNGWTCRRGQPGLVLIEPVVLN